MIVIFLNIFTNGYVATESRISGGRIANVLIICPVIFLISLYMIIIGSKNFLNKVCLIISACMIFFAYSRSTWWSTIFFTFIILCKIFYLDNMIKELTAKLLDKFLEEIKNEKNMTKIQNELLNPLITFTYKKIHPYLVLVIVIFLLTFILALLILIILIKKIL